MKIGEVSKELGIPSATLRYYEQIGLLEDVKKEHGIRAVSYTHLRAHET